MSAAYVELFEDEAAKLTALSDTIPILGERYSPAMEQMADKS